MNLNHHLYPIIMSDDIPVVQKGNLCVIKDTNVVIHPTDGKVLGIAVFEDGEWILAVPAEPTQAMCDAAEEYNYDLPPTREEIEEELEKAKDEISAVYRKMEELMEIYQRLEKLQEKL